MGFEQTRFHLQIDPKKLENIENQVNQHFANLLNYVFEENLEYFQKLLCPPKVVEQGNYGYFLSPDIAKILLRLSQMRQEGDSDIILIQLMFKNSLTFNEIRRLFTHIDLNIQSRIKELNLDTHIINLHLTHLKDLFSLHFEFGRAHFHLENHNILPYSRI